MEEGSKRFSVVKFDRFMEGDGEVHPASLTAREIAQDAADRSSVVYLTDDERLVVHDIESDTAYEIENPWRGVSPERLREAGSKPLVDVEPKRFWAVKFDRFMDGDGEMHPASLTARVFARDADRASVVYLTDDERLVVHDTESDTAYDLANALRGAFAERLRAAGIKPFVDIE